MPRAMAWMTEWREVTEEVVRLEVRLLRYLGVCLSVFPKGGQPVFV